MAETTTITITTETWRELNQRKRSGQTFNDVVQDALAPDGKVLPPEDEPEVVGQERVDEGECSHVYSSGNKCENDAEYRFTMEYNGNESTVLTCAEHGNAPDLEEA